MGVRRWAATVAGFAGTLAVPRPGTVAVSAPAVAPLAAAFAAAPVGTKKPAFTENPTPWHSISTR